MNEVLLLSITYNKFWNAAKRRGLNLIFGGGGGVTMNKLRSVLDFMHNTHIFKYALFLHIIVHR